MTTLDRSKKIRFLVLGVLVLAAVSCSQKQPQQGPSVPAASANKTAPINAEQLAKTYGLDSFDQIEAIRYTWNAQFPGANISRAWVWEPKKNQVSFTGKDKDGKPVKGLNAFALLNALCGAENTTVSVTVTRDGKAKTYVLKRVRLL